MSFLPKITPVRIMLFLLAIALLAFFGYVVFFDYVHDKEILPGIKAAEVSIGNLSTNRAEEKLTSELAVLYEPVVLRYGAYYWRLPSRDFIQIHTKRMVARAHRAGQKRSLWERTYRRWYLRSLDLNIPLDFTLDKKKLALYVAEVSKEIDREPVDAAIDVTEGTVHLIPSQAGKRVEKQEAVRETARLLSTELRFYRLPVQDLPPRKKIDDFKNIILIKRAAHTLSLYYQEQLIKTYPIAVGMPQYPTPHGSFKIARKRVNPTWYNPHSEWSADMPPIIPPGPDNPLGSRAMDLNTPGIRIHGTPNEKSIGYSASHGCIRMKMNDAEDLFAKVEIGTPVEIID